MRGKLAVRRVLALPLGARPALPRRHRDISLDPDKALVEVKVPSQSLYDELYADYDFVEAVQRNGDGSISTDVLVNAAERAALRARGVRFVKTLETQAATDRRVAERDAALAREARAQELAQSGAAACKGAKNAIPLPGEVTIMRAYTFTNYAGRFLYVEAHTKAATPVTPNGVEGSPTMALSFAGADGVFGAASNMPINRDTQTGIANNNVYMFHRHLVRVTRRRAQAGARGVERRRRRRGGRDRVGRHDAAAARRGLPARLLHALHGPDRDHRPVRLAGGRVLEPRRDRQPAQPDARLPAQGDDGDGRRRSARRTPARSATSAPPRPSRP